MVLFGNKNMKSILTILFILIFFLFPPRIYAQDSNQDPIVVKVLKILFGGSTDSSSSTSVGSSSPNVNQSQSIIDFLNTGSASYATDIFSKCLSNKSTYQQASSATGVPWQVLAGIHHREGSCGTNKSLVSGRTIGVVEPDVPSSTCSSQRIETGKPIPVGNGCGFASLLDSAIYAGNHLKGKIGSKVPETSEELIKALSRYNGGGNANCGKTPYANCPKKFYGEDDSYVMNLFDEKHTPMYVVYCADFTLCNPPRKDSRPGVATAIRFISILGL